MSLAEGPGFLGDFQALSREWPPFMLHDAHGEQHSDLLERFGDDSYVIVGDDGRVVGRVQSVPVPWRLGDPLPDRGWDAAIESAVTAAVLGTDTPNVCALEIMLRPDVRGRGLSDWAIVALRERAAARGAEALFAPVRPSRKGDDPAMAMAEYAALTREDGLPVDPWLRAHVRVGGEVVGVCGRSMTITGSLDEWRAWTGIDLSAHRGGAVAVAGGLTPVMVHATEPVAAYVEPNVWVVHRTRR